MNTIEIRLAKKEDAKFIALLGRMTFTETFGHFFRDQKDLIDYYNLTFSVQKIENGIKKPNNIFCCLLYTSPSPRDKRQSRMPSSA